MVKARLGVGLFGADAGGLVGVLAGGLVGVLAGGLVGAFAGGRLEATLRKGGGWGWANSHFGKEVKGVTTTEVGRWVGFPKLVLLSKLPAEQIEVIFCHLPYSYFISCKPTSC